MDRASALDQLPERYADALRMRARGLDDEQIATRLGVDRDTIAMLLRIGEAKLGALLAGGPPARHLSFWREFARFAAASGR